MASDTRESIGLKEINATEIMAKIEKGESVEYDHIIVKGDIDIHKINLPKDNEKLFVSSLIIIVNSRIDGVTHFSGAIFRNPINFQATEFLKYVDFSESIFLGDADFRGSRFSGYDLFYRSQFREHALFGRSQFGGYVEFVESQFDKIAVFEESQFVGYALFNASQFNEEGYFRKSRFGEGCGFNAAFFKGDAEFSESEFKGSAGFDACWFGGSAEFATIQFMEGASFTEAQFSRDAFFVGSLLNKDAEFSRSQFGEGAYFNNSVFKGTTNFHLSEFKEGAGFHETKFGGDVILSSSQINKTISFESAHFAKNFYLDAAKISSIRLLGAAFGDESKISLKESDIARLVVLWNQIKDHLTYDGAAYLSLTKNFRDSEQFEDADNCYYQYRTEKRIQGEVESKLLDCISWWLYGYGIRFHYPLLIGIGLLVISSGVFLYGKQAHSLWEAFDLSTVVLTTTTQVMNSQGANLTGFCRSWSIFERISGWLLMASFLVVLARKTIR